MDPHRLTSAEPTGRSRRATPPSGEPRQTLSADLAVMQRVTPAGDIAAALRQCSPKRDAGKSTTGPAAGAAGL